MSKTFTFIGDASTALDYARLRLDDIDELVTVDETQEPSPFLWDEAYAALFDKFGVQEGMAIAARIIGAKIAKFISSYGETQGSRFSKRNLSHYFQLPDQIRSEPPYDPDEVSSIAKIGGIKAGVDDTYWSYRRYEQYPTPCPPDESSDDD